MPDLSHRPTRYAVAAVSTAALIAVSSSTFDLQVSSKRQTIAAAHQTDALRRRVADLEADLAEARAPEEGVGGEPDPPPTAPMETEAADPEPGPAAPATHEPDCETYPYQEAAQVALQRDPAGRARLDGDGDGLACEQLKAKDLPIAGTAPPAPTAPPNTRPPQEPAEPAEPELPVVPSKAAIVASGKHFGLAAATTDELDSLEYTLGRDATISSYFKGWDTPYDSARVVSTWERGEIPMLTWETRALQSSADPTDYSLDRVIDGTFDDYLVSYARQIAELGLPLVIRFDHEMNGDWYRWGEFESEYGLEEGDYIAAWTHVHDIFDAEGANDHVIWLWSPNRVDNLDRYPPIDRYYPGDAYVDWVGMSGYLRPSDTTKATVSFAKTYDRTLAELRRVAPGKPILLSEIGATEDGGRKAEWTESFFPGLQANPDVIGFVWFNYAISEAGHTNDWRITSSPGIRDLVKAGLATTGYGRPTGAPPLLVPPDDQGPVPDDEDDP